jgi:hypothetical protein
MKKRLSGTTGFMLIKVEMGQYIEYLTIIFCLVLTAQLGRAIHFWNCGPKPRVLGYSRLFSVFFCFPNFIPSTQFIFQSLFHIFFIFVSFIVMKNKFVDEH